LEPESRSKICDRLRWKTEHRKQWYREWCLKNRDKRLAARKRAYVKFKEKYLSKAKAWRKAHPGCNTLYGKTWRSKLKISNPKKYHSFLSRARKRSRIYRLTHRSVLNAKSKISNRKRYDERRELLNRAKTVPCKDCRIQYNPWVMEFDHINPANKKFGLSSFNVVKHSIEKIKEEIDKCEVVCSNCHKERTHKMRQRGFISSNGNFIKFGLSAPVENL
jgi:hypothetical protein